MVGESFGAPQAKIAQPNPSRIITEAGTTDIPDAVLATLDDEPVQVRTRPTEGDLQHRVQTSDRRIGGDQQLPPDQRTDAAHYHPQPIHPRYVADGLVSGMAHIIALPTDGPPRG